MKTGRTTRQLIFGVLCLSLAATAFAGPGTTTPAGTDGEERILARHDDFTFPAARRPDGSRLPRGTYDLVLLETDDGLALQLIDRKTQRGARVSAIAVGHLAGSPEVSGETAVTIRASAGEDVLTFHGENIAAAFSLEEIRRGR